MHFYLKYFGAALWLTPVVFKKNLASTILLKDCDTKITFDLINMAILCVTKSIGSSTMIVRSTLRLIAK